MAENEQQKKRDAVVDGVCDVVEGVVDIGAAAAEGAGGIISGTIEIAGNAIEAVGGAAGEAMSGCAGCAPVVAAILLVPVGLVAGHLLF